MPACLCVPCAYTCVASLGHICDYVEGHLFGEFCDVMMYAMSVYKQPFIIRPIVHRRTVGGAQLQVMMETSTHVSSLGKYFVRDVLEIHFPLYR